MQEKKEPPKKIITHDGIIHHPLGGGSYVFKNNFAQYLANQINKEKVKISIGAQPNSAPHFGTLVVFNLAFALAQEISSSSNLETEVFFEVVDTAPARKKHVEGIGYQVSLRESGVAQAQLGEYSHLLEQLKEYSGVDYVIRKQSDFNAQKSIPQILKEVVQNREKLSAMLDPEKRLLRMRVACGDCGLTDKEGVNNRYTPESMDSYCPDHGWFTTSYDEDSEKFEYNTPLRNLVRALVYGKDNQDEHIPHEWVRVTGSDYAGFYQEQLLYKASSVLGYPAHHLPTIIYAPLITDWSGAKLSKSLYVKEGAYKDLPSYLVNYTEFREQLGESGAKKMFDEVTSWVQEPFKLFRHYSVHYFMEVFK